MIRPMVGFGCLMLATCGIVVAGASAQASREETGTPLAGPLAPVMTEFGAAKHGRPGHWLPAAFARPHVQALLDLPLIRFHNDRATLSDRTIARSTRAEFGTSSRLLTLEATRIRRPAADTQQITGLRRDRSSIMSLEAAYAVQVGGNDSVALTATAGAQKRKPLIAIAGSHWTGTSTLAAGLRWRHGGGVRLDAGWFSLDALRPLTVIDRNVSLAAGSAIAERGFRAEASVPLSLFAHSHARLGARFANATIAPDDRLALGAAAARDARGALWLGLRFP
ncbi:MAG TPA: hypothetical protein VNT42_11715 [Sphingomonas sp.]|nr:hypothetical protein [Sphingomonas sp.]